MKIILSFKLWLATGNIIWANDMELDILGYTADEFIGRNISEVKPYFNIDEMLYKQHLLIFH